MWLAPKTRAAQWIEQSPYSKMGWVWIHWQLSAAPKTCSLGEEETALHVNMCICKFMPAFCPLQARIVSILNNKSSVELEGHLENSTNDNCPFFYDMQICNCNLQHYCLSQIQLCSKIFPWPMLHPSTMFHVNCSSSFSVILLTVRQQHQKNNLFGEGKTAGWEHLGGLGV